MSPTLHVAAAAVINDAGEVLLAKRPDHVHQGGLWEFPGGKLEPGESVREALARELLEELGIETVAASPLIRIPHTYPDRKVVLDVWRVSRWHGEPHGREGQSVKWVPMADLESYAFPEANRPILAALRLPSLCLVTPEPGEVAQWPAFLAQLEQVLGHGVGMVQLRAKQLDAPAYRQLAGKVAKVCRRHDTLLMLNLPADGGIEVDAEGIHLSSRALREIVERPNVRWLSAACHDRDEMRRAVELGVDFLLLSPVQATTSHPDVEPLGWARFAAIAADCPVPVYALGGVGPADLERAQASGAQGVAAISALWAMGRGDA